MRPCGWEQSDVVNDENDVFIERRSFPAQLAPVAMSLEDPKAHLRRGPTLYQCGVVRGEADKR